MVKSEETISGQKARNTKPPAPLTTAANGKKKSRRRILRHQAPHEWAHPELSRLGQFLESVRNQQQAAGARRYATLFSDRSFNVYQSNTLLNASTSHQLSNRSVTGIVSISLSLLHLSSTNSLYTCKQTG